MMFFKKEPVISFRGIYGGFAAATPVILARDYKPDWLRKQTGESKFQKCPGMVDFFSAGYLVLAHADIRIKANSEGVFVIIEGPPLPHPALGTAFPFDFKMVEGMAPIRDGVSKFAGKITLPWSVKTRKGFSGYALPATMHSNFLDKLFVYPGVVDYDNFHTLNFVFSPLAECEFVIPAGTPLLQIIPFRRDEIDGVCDRATPREEDEHNHNIPTKISHYYRKFLGKPKPYKLECPYEHRKLNRDRET